MRRGRCRGCRRGGMWSEGTRSSSATSRRTASSRRAPDPGHRQAQRVPRDVAAGGDAACHADPRRRARAPGVLARGALHAPPLVARRSVARRRDRDAVSRGRGALDLAVLEGAGRVLGLVRQPRAQAPVALARMRHAGPRPRPLVRAAARVGVGRTRRSSSRPSRTRSSPGRAPTTSAPRASASPGWPSGGSRRSATAGRRGVPIRRGRTRSCRRTGIAESAAGYAHS
jgi:hypothetical protein